MHGPTARPAIARRRRRARLGRPRRGPKNSLIASSSAPRPTTASDADAIVTAWTQACSDCDPLRAERLDPRALERRRADVVRMERRSAESPTGIAGTAMEHL